MTDSKKADGEIESNAGVQQTPGDRIAKVMARRGLCSRRDAEVWISQGRVKVNGKVISEPGTKVTHKDNVIVDDEPLPMRERTRLWLYHKEQDLVTTARDEKGRTTIFDRLPKELPRTITVGRLDINTEGLLLLTNDGGLARVLELPKTGWLRRYRVRVFGQIDEDALKGLSDGITIEGISYGGVEAIIDRIQGHNTWLLVSLREGKNREIKRIMEHLGLKVSRLIRISYGPFQLGELAEGEVQEIRSKVLRDQLGERLIKEAEAYFPKGTEEVLISRPAPSRKRAGGKPERPSGRKLPSKAKIEGLQQDADAKPQRPKNLKPIGARGKPKHLALQDGSMKQSRGLEKPEDRNAKPFRRTASSHGVAGGPSKARPHSNRSGSGRTGSGRGGFGRGGR